MGVCISRSPALCLAPGPGPVFIFTGPGPNLYLPVLALNLYLPALFLNLCLPALAPNLYLPALAYNFIISPGPEFCIYRPCLLNLYLYLRPLPAICITGPRSEFAFTLLLVVEAVVVVIVVVVISLE